MSGLGSRGVGREGVLGRPAAPRPPIATDARELLARPVADGEARSFLPSLPRETF